MKSISKIIFYSASLFFVGTLGFALGYGNANIKRIEENPLYSQLEKVGVNVETDGFFCSDNSKYGLFNPETRSIALCIELHGKGGESVQSTLRHEAWHVLQSCYNSSNKKKIEGFQYEKGLPNGYGVFFTPEEYNQTFGVENGPIEFLGKEDYDQVIGAYPDDQEQSELEARSAELFYGDIIIASWINEFCQSLEDQ